MDQKENVINNKAVIDEVNSLVKRINTAVEKGDIKNSKEFEDAIKYTLEYKGEVDGYVDDICEDECTWYISAYLNITLGNISFDHVKVEVITDGNTETKSYAPDTYWDPGYWTGTCTTWGNSSDLDASDFSFENLSFDSEEEEKLFHELLESLEYVGLDLDEFFEEIITEFPEWDLEEEFD